MPSSNIIGKINEIFSKKMFFMFGNHEIVPKSSVNLAPPLSAILAPCLVLE